MVQSGIVPSSHSLHAQGLGQVLKESTELDPLVAKDVWVEVDACRQPFQVASAEWNKVGLLSAYFWPRT